MVHFAHLEFEAIAQGTHALVLTITEHNYVTLYSKQSNYI